VIRLLSFPKHAVPPIFAAQIRSFIRIQWPFLNGRGNKIWDYPPRENEPTSFILADDDMLISHAEANQRDIEFQGQLLRVGGLSAVFTYPAFRGTGCAQQTVSAATAHLQASNCDLAMLFCGPKLENFYTRCGWCAMPTAHVMYGEHDKPQLKDDNLIMMLFISDRGKGLKQTLTTEEIYVGPATW
jgi:predicted acetyltransferase